MFDDYSRIVSEVKYEIKYGEGLKILTPKQILHRLPKGLLQVKAGNTSEHLLNEIKTIIYSLYKSKEVTKQYTTILWIQYTYNIKMNTIFTNSGNIKTSDLHRLWINLTEKIDLRRKDKYIVLSNLNIYYTWKNIKKSFKNNKFKISAPTWNGEF